MSDRPTGANGKRNQAWGTTDICPACGRCLCFACHPEGPCVGDKSQAVSPISRHARVVVAAGASIVTQAFQS
jgi:hypothetical protein